MADDDRKYFFIKSRLHGMVFDIMGKNTAKGAPIGIYEQKDSDTDNQLFYEDSDTGTIRTKLNDFCIEASEEESSLCIAPYEQGNRDQQWTMSGGKVKNRHDDRVLDLANKSNEPGSRVVANANESQRFEFEPYTEKKRYFFVLSSMNDKALDVHGGCPDPGTQLIVWEQQMPPLDHQLWYLDKGGLLRSKLNDFVPDSDDPEDQIQMQPYDGKSSQQWIVDGNKIVNKANKGKCMDICKGHKRDGTDIISYPYKASDNQHWRLEYIDD